MWCCVSAHLFSIPSIVLQSVLCVLLFFSPFFLPCPTVSLPRHLLKLLKQSSHCVKSPADLCLATHVDYSRPRLCFAWRFRLSADACTLSIDPFSFSHDTQFFEITNTIPLRRCCSLLSTALRSTNIGSPHPRTLKPPQNLEKTPRHKLRTRPPLYCGIE